MLVGCIVVEYSCVEGCVKVVVLYASVVREVGTCDRQRVLGLAELEDFKCEGRGGGGQVG